MNKKDKNKEREKMNDWFANLLLSLAITTLIYWMDVFTNIIHYGFDFVSLFVISLLIWIVFNQCDMMKVKKEKKK